MPQSLANVLVHAVWSTKDRFAFLSDKPLRDELHRYLGGISARLASPTLMVGGVADHVHVLVRLSRTLAPAEWVKEMKRASTIWLTRQAPRMSLLTQFHWQAGYGLFSVSESMADKVRAYFAKQEAHHAKVTFQDEYRRFLRAHRLDWDESHVWG